MTKAPQKPEATHAGNPGGRFDLTPCLLLNFETFPSNTGLLADAQLLDDPLVGLGVTPLQILQEPFAPAHHVKEATP